eukprot:3933811-Rhodomonas_salina.4
MQQTQRFVAEFFQVLQPFAAAKSASTGKGALFVFSRPPPADLLCLDKQVLAKSAISYRYCPTTHAAIGLGSQ